MRLIYWTVISIALSVSVSIPSQARTANGVPAFVLDDEGGKVVKIDQTGKTLGTVDITGHPESILAARSDRIVVFARGEGKWTVRYGFHPTTKSTAMVIDGTAMKEIARVELGWGLGTRKVTSDGRRLVVFCPGYKSQKDAEALNSDLVIIDLASGETHRFSLPRNVADLQLTPDGDGAIVFLAKGKESKLSNAAPAQLQFIDSANLQIKGTVTLDGEPGLPLLSPDGRYVYLLDYGKPSKNADKNLDGRLFVVSVSDPKLEATHKLGSQPRSLVLDDASNRVLILSDRPGNKVKKDNKEKDKSEQRDLGEMRVVRGSELLATVHVATQPSFLRVAPDRKRLYVLGVDSLSAVNYDSLEPDG